MSIDTLECIENKQALTAEIHRVLKPGGHLLVMHWDWDTQLYNIHDKALARKAVQAFSDWQQPWMEHADGWMGRKLWGLFEGSGKFHGEADASCLIETDYKATLYGYERAQDLAGLVDIRGFDARAYAQFLCEPAESAERGDYFYSLTYFIYFAQRA